MAENVAFIISNQRTNNALIKADGLKGMNSSVGSPMIKAGGYNRTSTASGYSGYFTVTYYPDENSYWIEDGADPDGEFAGYIQVGEQNIHCVSEPVAAAGAGSFYVNVFYDADAELYDYEYAFEATIPSTPQEVNTELATLTAPVAPATEGNLTQRWTAGAINSINAGYVT